MGNFYYEKVAHPGTWIYFVLIGYNYIYRNKNNTLALCRLLTNTQRNVNEIQTSRRATLILVISLLYSLILTQRSIW